MSNLKQIKIARIVLDMGISCTELRKADNKWDKHKEVISFDYNNNKEKYRNRIKKIIDECLKQNVDIVIFPACTFLYCNEEEFNYYRSIVEKVEWVLSGALKIKDSSFKETAVILRKGEKFEKIGGSNVLGVGLDGISSRIAISSTIRKIRDSGIITSEVSPLSKNQNNIFAFDLGHHQYTGRYKMTLQSITRVLSEKANKGSAIFLSYWKYINGTSNYYWYETNDNIDISVNRKKLQVVDSNKVDFFDVFKINL